ncbi:DUF192 domain-containing protein [Flavobacteriaceae bacterium D16]|nr:DUF192 domain-containing protein [Flavobacteriaceae bacterium D16]
MPAKVNLYTFSKICLICSIFFALLTNCKEEPKKAITTEPITFSKEGELEIYKGETDSLLTRLDIEIADSDYEIQTGLMYREEMDANEAMLFVFPDMEFHSFYMKNTLIPLDIIFIDDQLRVVNFKQNATPLDEAGIPSGLPVQYVLEVNAGLSTSWNLEIGDRILYTKQ